MAWRGTGAGPGRVGTLLHMPAVTPPWHCRHVTTTSETGAGQRSGQGRRRAGEAPSGTTRPTPGASAVRGAMGGNDVPGARDLRGPKDPAVSATWSSSARRGQPVARVPPAPARTRRVPPVPARTEVPRSWSRRGHAAEGGEHVSRRRPAGSDLLDLLRMRGQHRPAADPMLRGHLQAIVEHALADVVAGRHPASGPPAASLLHGASSRETAGSSPVITKDTIARALLCEAHRPGAGWAPTVPSGPMAVGAMVEALFRQLVTTGSIDDPWSAAVEALEIDPRRAGIARWVRSLPRAVQGELAAEVERQATALQDRWPTLASRWLPRTGEVARVPLLGGLAELSARFDLAVGEQSLDRASIGIVELTTGVRQPRHRLDAAFSALVAALRDPAPPFMVATYYTRTGEVDVQGVTPELLIGAAHRAGAGIRRLWHTAPDAQRGPTPTAPRAARADGPRGPTGDPSGRERDGRAHGHPSCCMCDTGGSAMPDGHSRATRPRPDAPAELPPPASGHRSDDVDRPSWPGAGTGAHLAALVAMPDSPEIPPRSTYSDPDGGSRVDHRAARSASVTVSSSGVAFLRAQPVPGVPTATAPAVAPDLRARLDAAATAASAGRALPATRAARVDAWFLERARHDPASLRAPTEPFSWSPRAVRRSLALAVVGACVAGRFADPVHAAPVVAEAAVHRWEVTGDREFGWEPWYAGLGSGGRAVTLADAVAWATAIASLTSWTRRDGVDFAGSRERARVGRAPGVLIAGQFDALIPAGAGGPTGIVIAGGAPRGDVEARLVLPALARSLRPGGQPLPARVLGIWPEAQMSLLVDVDRDALERTADAVGAALVAVFGTDAALSA